MKAPQKYALLNFRLDPSLKARVDELIVKLSPLGIKLPPAALYRSLVERGVEFYERQLADGRATTDDNLGRKSEAGE